MRHRGRLIAVRRVSADRSKWPIRLIDGSGAFLAKGYCRRSLPVVQSTLGAQQRHHDKRLSARGWRDFERAGDPRRWDRGC